MRYALKRIDSSIRIRMLIEGMSTKIMEIPLNRHLCFAMRHINANFMFAKFDFVN